MAQSYRGLTIQIGGDTTKLNKALQSSNQAISGTQSALRKLSDALKMDPSSLQAAQLQVGAFAEQASNAATRLVTINDAMRQVGDKVKTFDGSAKTVREMADSWGDVSLKASQAREHYAGMTKALAENYTALSKLHAEAAKVGGKNNAEGLMGSVADMDFNGILERVTELRDAFGDSKGKLKEILSTVSKLKTEHEALTQEAEQYKEAMSKNDIELFDTNINGVMAQLPKMSGEATDAAIKFQNIQEKIAGIKTELGDAVEKLRKFKGVGEVFKFENDNVDLQSLAQALKDIVAAEHMTVEEADELMNTYIAMKDVFKEAFENVKTANTVEGFRDLEAESAKAAAKVTAMVNEMVKLSNTSDTAKGLVKLKDSFEEITKSGATAESRLEGILKILQKDGNENSTFLQREAMREYAEATAKAEEAIQNAREQLDAYDGSIRKMAASTKSYSAETAAAKQKYEEAAAALKGYEGAMKGIRELMDQKKEDDPKGFASDEEYQSLKQTYETMNGVLTTLKQRFADADKEKKKFVEIGEVRELTDKLANLEDHAKELKDINMKVNVDASALDGFNATLKALSKGVDLTGLGKFRENVQKAADVLSVAEKRYKALSDAAKADPTNSETLKQRTTALKQVIEATTKHIEAMRAELDAIPSDKVDQAALAAGTAKQKLAESKKTITEYKDAIVDLNKRIEDLEKQKASISGVDPESNKEIEKLNKSLDDLKARREALAAAGDAAFDSYVVAQNTVKVEENTTAIQRGEAACHKYNLEIEKAGHIKATPKIDEAAFMQVVDRISQAVRQMSQEIVQASNEIDSAYRDMRKTVNGTEAEFEGLKQAAVEFSQTKITSADTMLEMQALGGQLGVLVDDLEKFGTIGSNLDIATDMDAEDIALKLGQISNVLQLDIDGMQGFADALVRLGNNMPATESAIMAVAQRFGAVASTANFSGDEILAWSASIAATGQRSEAAATAIGNTVSAIEQAIAGGGEDLNQFAAIAGMSAQQFEDSWREGPTEALKAFIEGLKTLSESDESAVAALENMGITSVRQQQTLLGLSQTIESLDDALVMSKNAWGGVSDQWGQAGDAAIEAEKKSEGFSGALAIMQNNAQNLAASLGDGLIPMMDAASKVMAAITDILNEMPAWLKVAAADFGALTIVLSTLSPALNVFGKGIGGFLSTLAQSASIGDFIVKVSGLESVLMGAAEGGLNLVSVFKAGGPWVLGISAAVAALGLAINAIQEYNEEQERFQKATTGMTDAMDSVVTAYTSFEAGTEGAIESVKDLKESVDSVIDSQAQLADKMSEKWSDVGTNAAEVDYYAQKIAELADKSNLTEEKQAELAAAVEAFNDKTGAGVRILDENNGKLSESTERILETAEAWKQLAVSEAAYEMYKDVVKQRMKDQMELDKVTKSLVETQKDWAEWEGKSVDEVGLLEHATKEQREAYEDLEASIGSADETLSQLAASMTASAASASEVRRALTEAGEETKVFDELTEEEKALVIAAYNEMADGGIAAVKRAKDAISDIMATRRDVASGINDELEEQSKEALNQRYESAKTAATEAYNYQKSLYDKAYNDQKRIYDHEYDDLKNSLDSQYDALKRSLDKVYDTKKKEYDRQYDAYKRTLDSQYNALKQSLDKEYDALKEANDQKLKTVKRANEDEEAAHKKATDKYLDDLKKRYDESVKMAKAESDAKIDEIDRQIKALEDATEEEQDAIDERKEADKIAELQSDVENAKSRRKKAEAEKKLNDYLQEVQLNRHKRERREQKEVLEEQKQNIKDSVSAQTDAMKEQYEAQKSAYEEVREAQLEAIKRANEDEYEELKLRLSKEQDALKEANDLQLQNLKDANDQKLQNLKDANDAALEELKNSHTDQLDAVKRNQQAQLDALKESQQIALENLKASHTASLQELKAAQDAQLKLIKEGKDTQEAIETAAQEKSLEDEKSSLEAKNELALQKGLERNRLSDQQLTELDKRYGHYYDESQKANERDLNAKNDMALKKGIELNQLTDEQLTELDNMYGSYGEKNPSSYANGFYRSKDQVSTVLGEVAAKVGGTFDDLIDDAESSGFDMMVMYSNSMVEGYNDVLSQTVDSIAQSITNMLGFSVPKEGPMSHADKWGPDMVQLIADGIQSKQHLLIRQVERMSDAIENAFDPTLTVDAAYEALDTIGRNRTNALSAVVESSSAPTVNVSVNLSLSDVSIREDADIERLAELISQKMAAQAARQIAGRLG